MNSDRKMDGQENTSGVLDNMLNRQTSLKMKSMTSVYTGSWSKKTSVNVFKDKYSEQMG